MYFDADSGMHSDLPLGSMSSPSICNKGKFTITNLSKSVFL